MHLWNSVVNVAKDNKYVNKQNDFLDVISISVIIVVVVVAVSFLSYNIRG